MWFLVLKYFSLVWDEWSRPYVCCFDRLKRQLWNSSATYLQRNPLSSRAAKVLFVNLHLCVRTISPLVHCLQIWIVCMKHRKCTDVQNMHVWSFLYSSSFSSVATITRLLAHYDATVNVKKSEMFRGNCPPWTYDAFSLLSSSFELFLAEDERPFDTENSTLWIGIHLRPMRVPSEQSAKHFGIAVRSIARSECRFSPTLSSSYNVSFSQTPVVFQNIPFWDNKRTCSAFLAMSFSTMFLTWTRKTAKPNGLQGERSNRTKRISPLCSPTDWIEFTSLSC